VPPLHCVTGCVFPRYKPNTSALHDGSPALYLARQHTPARVRVGQREPCCVQPPERLIVDDQWEHHHSARSSSLQQVSASVAAGRQPASASQGSSGGSVGVRYRHLSLFCSIIISIGGNMTIPDDLSCAKQSVRASPRGTLSIACVQHSSKYTRHRYRRAIWQRWRTASDAIPQLAAALPTEPHRTATASPARGSSAGQKLLCTSRKGTIALCQWQPQPCSVVRPATTRQPPDRADPVPAYEASTYRWPSATNLTPPTPIAASPRRSLMTRAFQSAAFPVSALITLKFRAQEATTPTSHTRPPPCRRHG
jgi:hypothetical protein